MHLKKDYRRSTLYLKKKFRLKLVSEVPVVFVGRLNCFSVLLWIKLEALNNSDSQPQQQISNRMTEKEKIQSVAVIQSPDFQCCFRTLRELFINKCLETSMNLRNEAWA